MKAGVVVPVYNTAPWLPRCLDSLVAQTEKDLVVVIVDDGSTDESPAIIAKYRSAEPRLFRTLRQENAGQAAARNKGLDELAAIGVDFVLFVDSDDWVEPGFVSRLIGAASDNDADIACCELVRAYDEAGHFRHEAAIDDEWRSISDGSLHDEPRWLTSRPGGIVDKAFRFSLFKDIRFSEGITFEDLATTPRLLRRARRIVAVREQLYFYFQRASSTVGSGDRRYLHAQEAIRILKEDFGGDFAGELEFVAVMRAAVGIAPRAARLPSWREDLPMLVKFLDKEFPGWRDNPYLKGIQGRKNRLILALMKVRAFVLLKALVDGKRQLAAAAGRRRSQGAEAGQLDAGKR